MQTPPPAPFNPTELDLLVEFLQQCPGRLSAALIPGSWAGDALVETLRARLAPMPLEIADINLLPGQLGALAIKCGESDAVLAIPMDGRRIFPSDDAAREFWQSLNYQRESLASGKVRTLFLLNNEQDLHMIYHADDLREWVRSFHFPDALPPRDDSELQRLTSWKDDFAEEPVHAPLEILRDQFNRARDAGFSHKQLTRDYAAPLFEALVARHLASEARQCWNNYIGDDTALYGFSIESKLDLLHARIMLAILERNSIDRDIWKKRMLSEAETALGEIVGDKISEQTLLWFRLSVLLDKQAAPENALFYMRKVVEGCEQLAAKNPDAYGPNLAGSLNNLATMLSAMGQHEDAREAAMKAVEGYTQLAAKNPDAYGPYLAGSLNNLANILSEVGQREAALEAAKKAVEMHTQLAAKNPDAYRPDLAMTLNNLANILSEVGQREAALEASKKAVESYTQLAAKNPEAYGSYLAASLNTIANRLSNMGQHEEALEASKKAVEMRTRLAAKNPDAYGPDLAMSLNNLATFLSAMGQHEEAFDASKEAVEMYTQLAAKNPDAYGPYLAASLNNLANRFSNMGQHEEALEASKKSVEMRMQLAAKNPDAYGPGQAVSLNNLASTLSDMGQHEEALEAAKKAVEMRTQLAAKNPDAYGPDLATSYGAICQVYQGLERWDDAVEAAKAGLVTLYPLFERHPQAFAKLIAALCKEYGSSCEKAACEPDIQLLTPIAEMLQTLQGESPSKQN